ncbi:tripartite motif-containing protein 60-like [Nannospalax galili]|uniref:tripartite motif-containing protein 60-like n=1 Tax=Nannospalax galili TaxID=1026970 RepID=UPI0004ED0B0E|nr:tripartite motif-containing protein 60-like [Nannospalax galili]
MADLREECGCPICLDFFKDPVTTNCGHNFCFSCLSVSWKDVNSSFPCPVCRVCFPQRSFRRNALLQNLTEMVKCLQNRRSKRKRQEEHAVCQKHNQALTLFCVKDLEVLCTQCSFSVEHQKHYICPIKRAASYYREILEGSIESLKSNVERVEKVLSLQGRRSLELKQKVGRRRDEIHSEFEQVRLFLQNEREEMLKEIQIEELDVLSQLHGNLGTLTDHVSTLEHLLEEAENKDVGSDVTFLTGVKNVYQRFQNLKCPEPLSFSLQQYGFYLPPQYSGLDIIIKSFQVDVTFDLDTAHPQLLVSKDRRTVMYKEARQSVSENPRRFALCPAVLGSERFHSGRHYWVVKVENKSKWTVGVCQDCLPRNWGNQPLLVAGLWAIGTYTNYNYVTYGPKKTRLLPVVHPSKIGIFLDYEVGEVSFFNMDDRSLLYTFRDSFTRPVCPYFFVGTDPIPLKILPKQDQER